MIALTTTLLVVPAVAGAQVRPTPPAAPASPNPPAYLPESRSASETRKDLVEVLKKYPPAVGRMLKQDPGLMSNTQYMAPYPAVAQFVAQHPEVARNPSYFFENFESYYSGSTYQLTDRDRALDMWRNIVEGFTFLIGFLSVIGALTWIIRSIIEHRRWSRLAKVQAEVHNKLIDRLASNDEMLAYIQSPAGAGFLKAGPAAAPGAADKSIHAPFGRILWSAQAGGVMLALGTGLRWVTVTAPNEVVEMLRFVGLIGQALGAGFLVSSALAYILSRQMGLIDKSTARERDTPSHS